MKKFIPLFIVGGLVLLGIGIYIVVNHIGMATRTGVSAEPANFWLGLWQGAIVWLSFIASWFDQDIVLYQINNNGFWYNFGYVIGIGIAVGGSAGRSRGKNRKVGMKTVPECE